MAMCSLILDVIRQQMKTHYDVLNLEKNCSAKDIKDSFIKLSKKYHPDKNKSSDAHKRFVEVNEAYSVLGKASSRCSYDATLSHSGPRVHCTTGCNTKTPYEYYTEMYARNMRKNQEAGKGYYTKSKLTAFFFCCLLMAFGSGLQLIAESHRRAIRSQEIATFLKDNKQRCSNLGARQVLKEMEERATKSRYKQIRREQ